MSEELKPCPFCGGKAVTKEGKNHAKIHVHWVECGNYQHCQVHCCTNQVGTEKQAIKIWETRDDQA